uniref:Uncharacterized protein n=1 Tax=Candidatus Kentrum sp. LPFa TaxID=2126335 RepID=A0A450WU85_9GAMM|nr:MAG: hypothetical protein BECKLPF1236A_GA0070988_102673 [Candidatus Kentron sp. LPFa]VFK34269.1 MAG: hypothetical protein BECKLPF1236C_GA0070990_102553 [Candidatus Kentron sp. LPFa]
MLALRAKTEEGALISRPGFSEFLFFRYVNLLPKPKTLGAQDLSFWSRWQGSS